MQEMLIPTSYIMGAGLGESVALITDGRFSGGTRGACIGQEAFASSIMVDSCSWAQYLDLTGRESRLGRLQVVVRIAGEVVHGRVSSEPILRFVCRIQMSVRPGDPLGEMKYPVVAEG